MWSKMACNHLAPSCWLVRILWTTSSTTKPSTKLSFKKVWLQKRVTCYRYALLICLIPVGLRVTTSNRDNESLISSHAYVCDLTGKKNKKLTAQKSERLRRGNGEACACLTRQRERIVIVYKLVGWLKTSRFYKNNGNENEWNHVYSNTNLIIMKWRCWSVRLSTSLYNTAKVN